MKFDHVFRDPALYELALTHRSIGRPNNERLEFLGDALLDLVVAEMLFEAHPNASEGELTRLRSELVNGKRLAGLARKLELGDKLRLGPGELKSGGYRRDSILADAFEALIAAVYLDAGFDACRHVVKRQFEALVQDMPRSHKDAKTRLQEWLQARGLSLPSYALLAAHGEDHARTFEVACSLDEPQATRFEAQGRSRRAAEQSAAEQALAWLERGETS
ncbi:ribonuclease III [Oleiagrimonas soli]|uniref:Ribonuclease 3 n=1 Tax=Oleiagrimonas soli TaxID=1543381 RepID=A0A099CUW3_9GAMM|nr:ribonuclease III [Oleiagrimonas soli]KGI77461.1 ribonuclease III [Oleiagrimonas soli]MBB6183093.1 ribonuclease-3 [Oleiagrimonas soli]